MWGLFENGNISNRPASELSNIIREFFPIGGEKKDASEWREYALCSQTNPVAFFPEKGGSTRDAKAVCVNCIVKAQCLEYAIEKDIRYGIWGGRSERERRRIKQAEYGNAGNLDYADYADYMDELDELDELAEVA